MFLTCSNSLALGLIQYVHIQKVIQQKNKMASSSSLVSGKNKTLAFVLIMTRNTVLGALLISLMANF